MIGPIEIRTLYPMTATPSDHDPSDDELAAIIARRGGSVQDSRAAGAAFEQLYGRHARLLSAFLSAHIRRDRLDDLSQEVWHRIWHHLPGQYKGGNFRAWLHQIARYALIDQMRKQQPESLEGQAERADPRTHSVIERLIDHERREVLRRCLERLGGDAAALAKGRLGGEDYSELCERLGLKPERAHRLWHTVKTQLRTCVEQAPA
ncbi:sigma-70 family RNA polymerase sigma factor [Singulisphaera sp. Ch08]|uniref:Sigma-70 family RNA polymerase sigma factor n=1 Tax=Singulisphaera sp. Ch08 TaxID=3120278 RepID=A0AAU7CB14_9BACT